MTDVSIKLVESTEELETYRNMTTYAFAPSPPRSQLDEQSHSPDKDYFSDSRRYILYDDEKPASTLHAINMTENVRGKVFPMQGIAGVSTYPEDRRKGFVKKLMLHTLKQGYEHGEVFTTLYPFRQSFYGKFGYITFPQARSVTVKPSNLKDLMNFAHEGEVERSLIGEEIERYYSFMQQYQRQFHGFALFSRTQEERLEKSKSWVIFAKVDREDRGMMIFSTTGFEKELKVGTFLYQDNNAKYVLLDHLARHVDQFSEISIRITPKDRPETWIYDSRPVVKSRDWVPSPMGRVLDISKIAGLKVGYGALSVKVLDEYCPWNAGNWLLGSDNGLLTVTKLNGDAEIDAELTIQGLSALVYGGYELDDMVLRGWVSRGADLDSLKQLFPDELAVLFSIF